MKSRRMAASLSEYPPLACQKIHVDHNGAPNKFDESAQTKFSTIVLTVRAISCSKPKVSFTSVYLRMSMALFCSLRNVCRDWSY